MQNRWCCLTNWAQGLIPWKGRRWRGRLWKICFTGKFPALVATHYPELKAFAHTTPGVENASMEFDVETLAPTYRLTIGLPGRSNAFAIATRLGLDRPIVERARENVGKNNAELETLLAELEEGA